MRFSYSFERVAIRGKREEDAEMDVCLMFLFDAKLYVDGNDLPPREEMDYCFGKGNNADSYEIEYTAEELNNAFNGGKKRSNSIPVTAQGSVGGGNNGGGMVNVVAVNYGTASAKVTTINK